MDDEWTKQARDILASEDGAATTAELRAGISHALRAAWRKGMEDAAAEVERIDAGTSDHIGGQWIADCIRALAKEPEPCVVVGTVSYSPRDKGRL